MPFDSQSINVFLGRWFTTFGLMTLETRGGRIAGSYQYGNTEGRLEGVATGDTLEFTYEEPSERGRGTFRLVRPGRFVGSYTADDVQAGSGAGRASAGGTAYGKAASAASGWSTKPAAFTAITKARALRASRAVA